jgi:hypothetical protein
MRVFRGRAVTATAAADRRRGDRDTETRGRADHVVPVRPVRPVLPAAA